MTAAPIGMFSADLADRVPIGIGFVVNLVRRVADVLLPMLRPVQILVAQLRRCLHVFADIHAINHGPDERGKAEDQEDNSENPAKCTHAN